MSNHRRRKHHSAVAKKATQKFFRSIAPTILAIILRLTATHALSAQESQIHTKPIPELIVQSRTLTAGASASGNQITLNGRTLAGAWLQESRTDGQVKTHLSDGAFRQFMGVDFLSSNSAARQPV